MRPIKSQQFTKTPVGKYTPANVAVAAIEPVGTTVPTGFVFVETNYEPDVNITRQGVVSLSDNDLLTGLKKQQKRTQAELDAFVVFYDEVVKRYSDVQLRTESGQFQPSDRPTLPEAFVAIGLSYEAERKRKQRYLAASDVRLATQKALQLTAGDAIQSKSNGLKGEVEKVHETAAKADIVFEGAKEAVTVPIAALKKVPARKVKDGDLVIDAITGAEYVYAGNGKLPPGRGPQGYAIEHRRHHLPWWYM